MSPVNTITPITDTAKFTAELLRNIFTNVQINIPTNPIIKKDPREVRSFEVAYPYIDMIANNKEQIRKVLLIEVVVYMRRIGDKETPRHVE